SGCTVKSTVRTVYDCKISRDGETVIFSVTGNGFLYNMVRIMVGTLLDISDGKIAEPITDIIEAKDRSRAGITAPACGLYLNKVFYESGAENDD
ncbi:MAG: tRNA pseudouridine(38-40) synthase TruA, partial [Acutalibacteraceae bacterium]